MHTFLSVRTLVATTMVVALIYPPVARRSRASPRLKTRVSPWGISSSSSSFRNHTEWFPTMSAAGVATVRLFPEWRGLEPTKGTWKWDHADTLVKSAADNKIEINGILMGSAPWSNAKAHAFPMDNLEHWSGYVSTVVGRYKDKIHYWEVWNEGNGGFNDGHHTTADYAHLVAATYAAAKKADPKAQVGLTVASYDAPYLNQTILALAKAGQADRFDYLCIHPYEIADGLADPDGERGPLCLQEPRHLVRRLQGGRLANPHLARHDASFSRMWGHDFSIRPEQSIPFVIGKVEGSKVPFK